MTKCSMSSALLDLRSDYEGDCQVNPAVIAQVVWKPGGSPKGIRQSTLPRKTSKLNLKETVP